MISSACLPPGRSPLPSWCSSLASSSTAATSASGELEGRAREMAGSGRTLMETVVFQWSRSLEVAEVYSSMGAQGKWSSAGFDSATHPMPSRPRGPPHLLALISSRYETEGVLTNIAPFAGSELVADHPWQALAPVAPAAARGLHIVARRVRGATPPVVVDDAAGAVVAAAAPVDPPPHLRHRELQREHPGPCINRTAAAGSCLICRESCSRKSRRSSRRRRERRSRTAATRARSPWFCAASRSSSAPRTRSRRTRSPHSASSSSRRTWRLSASRTCAGGRRRRSGRSRTLFSFGTHSHTHRTDQCLAEELARARS